MCSGRIPHGLDCVVVHLRTVLNPLVELVLRLVCLVHISCHPTLHEPSSMVDGGVDDTVRDSFSDDILRVLLRVEVELDADVGERDT